MILTKLIIHIKLVCYIQYIALGIHCQPIFVLFIIFYIKCNLLFTTVVICFYRACDKSLMISFALSNPIDRRIVFGFIPDSINSSSLNCE